jgi:hypothetical protein
VTVFRPAREEEVIAMQQVKEIHGRENGWDDSTHHSAHQVHPQQQVFTAPENQLLRPVEYNGQLPAR